MSAVMSPTLIYSGALLLLSFCAFRWVGPYSISDLLMGANVVTMIMSTELLTLFLYMAFLSSIVVYSLRLMDTCSKGVDDTGAKKHNQFHDQEENTMGADEDYQQDDDCQKEHRAAEHEESCKEGAAELRDKILFQQPESTYLGDCPICLLPIGDISTCVMESCCSTFICNGCSYSNRQRELEDDLDQRCPFCRATPPATYEEGYAKKMKRVEANDPLALDEVGKKHYHNGDFSAAFEYWKRAIEGEGPGAISAHAHLSNLYEKGLGGAEKDEEKEKYHLEVASIAGHPKARCLLASYEGRRGNKDRANKHLIIAVKQGSTDAIQTMQRFYAKGAINKEGFAALLRAYQKAVEATKSPQRELAAKSIAQGLHPWDRVQSQAQSRALFIQSQTGNRVVNGTRSRGGRSRQRRERGNRRSSTKNRRRYRRRVSSQ